MTVFEVYSLAVRSAFLITACFALCACAPNVPPADGGTAGDTDTVDDTGSGSGAGSGSSGETAGSSGGAAEGECLDPLAQPYDRLECSRGECNPALACPDGYACEASTCVCEDIDVCGYACDETADCREDTQCDPATGVCRQALSCLLLADCADGQNCVKRRPFEELNAERECVPTGSVPLGEDCQLDEDCQSGVCSDVCLQSCRSNADCPAELRCAATNSTNALGCVLPSSTNCEPSCDADAAHCSGNECVSDNCSTNADCDSGRCRLSLYGPDSGRCEAEQTPCGADEFGFEDVHPDSEPICFIDVSCWNDAGCPAGYACIVPKTTSNSPVALHGWCGV